MNSQPDYADLIKKCSTWFSSIEFSKISNPEVHQLSLTHSLTAHTFHIAKASVSAHEARDHVTSLILARICLEFSVTAQYVALHPHGRENVLRKIAKYGVNGSKKSQAFFGKPAEDAKFWQDFLRSFESNDNLTFQEIASAFKEQTLLEHLYSYLSSFVHVSGSIFELYTHSGDGLNGEYQLLETPNFDKLGNPLQVIAYACVLGLGAVGHLANNLINPIVLDHLVNKFGFQAHLTFIKL